ncbi:MAG: isocitrate lyase/PEP mutase family protein [Deltaproteobacteria bacterium]|nr:isocitrate lyase/PEP mutase family protein [Deltaproteobacteria bacterium]
MNDRQILQELLKVEQPLVMPDAYDGLSARLIQMAGFKAVQCSGFSIGLASRAAPEQAVDFDKNLDTTRDIVRAVTIPVMADGEDGFGPPASVYKTVGAFLDVGVSGINLEDQVLPTPKAKDVIDPVLMVEKIKAARDAARDKHAADMVINARTDALAACDDRLKGIAEAIIRGNKYLQAGADLVFVTAVATPDEAKRIVDGIEGPVSIAAGMPYNINTLTIGQLRACGVARVSLPAIAVFSAIQAIKKTLLIIRDSDSFEGIIKEGLLCSPGDLSQVLLR